MSLSKQLCRVWPIIVLVSGCAGAARRTDAPPSGFSPIADHHLHLLSAEAAATALRETTLPAPLDSLVAERRDRWNDAAGLARLYTDAAVLYSGSSWLTGPQAIAAHLAKGYTGPYYFKPHTYRIEGSRAQMTGFMLEGDGTNVPFGFFHLDLDRTADGTWRIASEVQTFPGPAIEKPVTAAMMVKRLDEAGIRRGVVLSDAYYFALTPEPRPGEHDRVRAENDWTAEQVAQFPDRLVAFCSFHPLRDYALAELERCASSGRFKGVKLHLNAAQIGYEDAEQVAKLRRVVEAANGRRLPLIIHVRSGNDYGRRHAEIFLRQIIAAAPDVPVQIAHLWGGESFSAEALDVYADAVAEMAPVAKNLYFDISGISPLYTKPDEMAQIVAAIRRIGLNRILYASDAPPLEYWTSFQKLPLTEAELRAIARNVAPYLRP